MKDELGRTGLKHYGGRINEEFLKELSGLRGVRVYREMADNDDITGGILFAIKMLIRQADWTVRAGSGEDIDNEAAQFVESCLHDMNQTWTDTVSEILSFLTYGWSVHEIVYKRRMGKNKDPRLDSKYDDGLIGWQKLPIRAQESLYQWEYDSHDNLTAFVQTAYPDFKIIRIPYEKILHFRTESRKDNPEGRSILRNAYRSWFFKKRIQEIEGIGIERDLAGFPVLIAPPEVDIWSESNLGLKAICDEFISNIRRDALEGITLPHGWELKLLSTGGKRQFDTSAIIERYDSRIAMTVLADFLMLGHESTGSWALSSDKTRLFAVAIGAFLDIIAEVFNRKAIPALLEMNKDKFGQAALPTLEHGDLETTNLKELGEYLKCLSELGFIAPDENLEEYLRMQASLPPRLEE